MFHVKSLLRTVNAQNLRRFCSRDLKYQVYESIRDVDPFATVQINCCLNAIIRPLDLFNYPHSNKLRVLAFADSQNSKVEIKERGNAKAIEIFEDSGQKEGTSCIFEVPVKCNLKVNSEQDAHISELYSDHIDVTAKGNIFTKNLRSISLKLLSNGGNIACDGLILAQEIGIEAKASGSIHLDKIQGDLLECTSSAGGITTNSCYAEVSKFVTESGALNLGNIHKKSSVHVLKRGDVRMTGVNGSVLVKTNGGDLNLQFSSLIDENVILSNDSKSVFINISDLIEGSCFVDLQSDEIVLDESAFHLLHCLDGNRFRLGSDDCKNKLLACTSGKLILGKSSWAESLVASMAFKDL